MKAILKCWDAEEEKWIWENNDDDIQPEFSYSKGKWKVRYAVEKNIMNGDIEIDAPVWVDVENPQISVHFLHDTNVGFYLSIPLNTKV